MMRIGFARTTALVSPLVLLMTGAPSPAEGDPAARTGAGSAVGVCTSAQAVRRGQQWGQPTVENAAEMEEACRACDLEACVRVAWRWAFRAPTDTDRAQEIARGACARGDKGSCVLGAGLARRTGSAWLAKLEAQGCALDDTWTCVRSTRRALEIGDRAAAQEFWARACKAGSDWACAAPVEAVRPRSDIELTPKTQELLDAAGVTLEIPQGFELVPPKTNRHMAYQVALRSTTQRLEVRYAVYLARPTRSCAADPKCRFQPRTPLGPTNVMTNALNVTAGNSSSVRPFSAPAVLYEFGADWGGSAVGDLRGDFGTDLKKALVLGLNRSDGSEVGIVFMFDDLDAVGGAFDAVFHALRFASP